MAGMALCAQCAVQQGRRKRANRNERGGGHGRTLPIRWRRGRVGGGFPFAGLGRKKRKGEEEQIDGRGIAEAHNSWRGGGKKKHGKKERSADSARPRTGPRPDVSVTWTEWKNQKRKKKKGREDERRPGDRALWRPSYAEAQ